MITVYDDDESVTTMLMPDVVCTIRRPVITAVATMETGKAGPIVATGVAVCAPCDHWDPKVGLTLATARAVRLIAEAMEHYGNEAAARRHKTSH